jgi:hypothetical protein
LLSWSGILHWSDVISFSCTVCQQYPCMSIFNHLTIKASSLKLEQCFFLSTLFKDHLAVKRIEWITLYRKAYFIMFTCLMFLISFLVFKHKFSLRITVGKMRKKSTHLEDSQKCWQ